MYKILLLHSLIESRLPIICKDDYSQSLKWYLSRKMH